MRIWPFKPRTPVIETLEWATDVMQSKTSEQRIGLRTQPRRSFSFRHTLLDEMANNARVLIRNAQGSDGFYVPDWTQARKVGAVSAGSGVVISADLSTVNMGSNALLWDSETDNEIVSVAATPTNVTADVSSSYSDAYLVPAWLGDTPDGLSTVRRGAKINEQGISFVLSESIDLSASTYPTYRGHDVMTDCPIVASASLTENTSFDLTVFGSAAGDDSYVRARDIPLQSLQMRWHKFTDADEYALRQWLHSRRGRLKAFWMSSVGHDLEVASFSGTTLTVFNDILARPAPFDVEILIDGAKQYRQITAASSGAPVSGRSTVDLTLDSAMTGSSISRVSMLYCVRLDTDRVELEHGAKAGMRIQVPVREVPVP